MSDAIKPVAEIVCGRLRWAIPEDDYVLPTRFLNNETHALYDQATLDAAIAAERERCAKLCETLRFCGRGDCDDLAAAIRQPVDNLQQQ